MKTLISILVLSLFVSISADARGPKGGKSIFNKWSPYSLKERLPFKFEDVWKNQYRIITPIIPTKCKYQEEGETKINEECLKEHRLNQKKRLSPNAFDILENRILELEKDKTK